MSGQSKMIAKKNLLKSIGEILFMNWNVLRWIRLGLGLSILYYAIQRPDVLSGIIASFFLIQAITNTGCCLMASCALSKKAMDTNEDVQYEEIKSKK